MNEFLDNLPSSRNMIKLILFLILAVVAVALVLAIVKMLMPLVILGAVVVGGVYLVRQLRTTHA